MQITWGSSLRWVIRCDKLPGRRRRKLHNEPPSCFTWRENRMPLELDLSKMRRGTDLLKRGFAKMQKGGVVMDVTNAEQAAIAEEAGAVAVMALERVPAGLRAAGGGGRRAPPLRSRGHTAAATR